MIDWITCLFFICHAGDPRGEINRLPPPDADPIAVVEVIDAGQSALGALNAAGVSCKVTFGADAAVIDFQSGRHEIWALNEGAALLSFEVEADHRCHLRSDVLQGNGLVVGVIELSGDGGYLDLMGDTVMSNATGYGLTVRGNVFLQGSYHIEGEP